MESSVLSVLSFGVDFVFRTFRTFPDFSENADPVAGFARNVIKSKDRDDTGLLKPRESLERRFPYASEDPLRNACARGADRPGYHTS